MSVILDIKNIKKSFGGLTPIKDVSFSVKKQNVVLITGENGTGKTTLFNLITGLEKVTKGSVVFNKLDVTFLSALEIARKGVVRLFQSPRLFNNLLVWENLVAATNYINDDSIFDLIFKYNTVKRKDVGLKKEAINLLVMFGLQDLSHLSAGKLSYGQQKLISFCMIVMNKPELVLLDEPFSGLNPQMIERFSTMVLEMKKKGMTFLIIEHNINEALKIATNHLFLSRGEIINITK